VVEQPGQTVLLLLAISLLRAGQAPVQQVRVTLAVFAPARPQERLGRELARWGQALAAFALAAVQASSQKWETTSVQAVSRAPASRRGALKLEFPLLQERRGQPFAVQVHQQMA
jgi:hypothetical protein